MYSVVYFLFHNVMHLIWPINYSVTNEPYYPSFFLYFLLGSLLDQTASSKDNFMQKWIKEVW